MKNTDKVELNMINLDKISGGVIGEVANDSAFLHKYGLMDEEFNDFEVMGDWNGCSDKVSQGWEKIGITCTTHPASDNVYFYKCHPITYREAREIAKQKLIQGPKIGYQIPGLQ